MEFFKKSVSCVDTVQDIFDIPRYLNSLKGEDKSFMKEFINTQNFAGFLETAHKTRTGNNEVSYFLKGAKLLLFYGETGLDLYCDQILNEAVESKRNVYFCFNCL
eukprot:TRINITY_DN7018_c0_g4_i3.p1 TRINITY_DN7018_c0_g4~~TRINITY_DN7018_c0_g4_i3.p1  ORF type:complete len:105 (+),score=16.22 TRINITY_DN7018_c0_g4_i3:1081-1395(+)